MYNQGKTYPGGGHVTQMVRKQIYIQKRQQILLKRLSEARGVSEAEIIRQAIDREASRATTQPTTRDRAAWEEVLHFVEARKTQGAAGEPYRWRREDAYEERLKRFDRKGA